MFSVFEVVGVVTQPPKRRKRKGKEIPSPVGLLAEELDIPVLCPEKVRNSIRFVTYTYVAHYIYICPVFIILTRDCSIYLFSK